MYIKILTLILTTIMVYGASNIAPVQSFISEQDRIERMGHQPKIFWLTGLSGAGKSTLALALEKALFDKGYFVKLIDGDNLRSDLCTDLQFSANARTENIRRAGAICELFRQSGFMVIASFISPIKVDRDKLKERFKEDFHEIYVKSSVEECVKRDPKGFYKKALEGKIQDFTGIKQSYEEPDQPHLIVDTELNDKDASVQMLLEYCEAALCESR